jgi:hypothetical protein
VIVSKILIILSIIDIKLKIFYTSKCGEAFVDLMPRVATAKKDCIFSGVKTTKLERDISCINNTHVLLFFAKTDNFLNCILNG